MKKKSKIIISLAFFVSVVILIFLAGKTFSQRQIYINKTIAHCGEGVLQITESIDSFMIGFYPEDNGGANTHVVIRSVNQKCEEQDGCELDEIIYEAETDKGHKIYPPARLLNSRTYTGVEPPSRNGLYRSAYKDWVPFEFQIDGYEVITMTFGEIVRTYCYEGGHITLEPKKLYSADSEADDKVQDFGVDIETATKSSSQEFGNDLITCSTKISYALIQNIEQDEILQRINDRIEEEVKNVFIYYHQPNSENQFFPNVNGIDSSDLSGAVDIFMSQCKVERYRILDLVLSGEPSPAVNIDYQNINSTITYNQNGLLSLRIDMQKEFGGAHPIYYSSALTFDLTTGKVIDLNKMFGKDMGEYCTLEKEQLINFYPNRFPLINEALDAGENVICPKMFYLTSDGMASLYQDYEITSHAEGPPKVVVPYEQLIDIIKIDL